MPRLTAWIGGAVGGFVAYRLLRRAKLEPGLEPGPPGPDERAEELRAKLAETRSEEEPEPGAPTESSEPAPRESPEDKRRRVHEEGRAAIDEMQQE